MTAHALTTISAVNIFGSKN